MSKFPKIITEDSADNHTQVDLGQRTTAVANSASAQWNLRNSCKAQVMVTFHVGTRPALVYRLDLQQSNRVVAFKGADAIEILSQMNWHLNYGEEAAGSILVYEADDGQPNTPTWWIQNSSSRWICVKIAVKPPQGYRNAYITFMLMP